MFFRLVFSRHACLQTLLWEMHHTPHPSPSTARLFFVICIHRPRYYSSKKRDVKKKKSSLQIPRIPSRYLCGRRCRELVMYTTPPKLALPVSEDRHVASPDPPSPRAAVWEAVESGSALREKFAARRAASPSRSPKASPREHSSDPEVRVQRVLPSEVVPTRKTSRAATASSRLETDRSPATSPRGADRTPTQEDRDRATVWNLVRLWQPCCMVHPLTSLTRWKTGKAQTPAVSVLSLPLFLSSRHKMSDTFRGRRSSTNG
jgi:hypothetical protein